VEIEALIENARAGAYRPVHVLVGAERFLVERAVRLLRRAAIGEGPTGFNDDVFHGRGATARNVLGAARTLPMMAAARFVLVRDADAMDAAQLDAFVEYLADPSPSTCLVLVADKLDGRSKLIKAAKKAGVLSEAKELKAGALRAFVNAEAKQRGHALSPEAGAALADALGSDLAAIDDALERLSLYVGTGSPIELEAVEASVTRIRTDTVWALVDAVSARDRRRALGAAASLLADREPPLRVLALVARQMRMVAKMREALAAGLSAPEAAKRAGAPPFKARELTEAARRFTLDDLRLAFGTLAEADIELKGSKRAGGRVLEEALLRLCTPGARPRYSEVVRQRRRLL
jgi:DNA polymerase-3 subunit delta